MTTETSDMDGLTPAMLDAIDQAALVTKEDQGAITWLGMRVGSHGQSDPTRRKTAELAGRYGGPVAAVVQRIGTGWSPSLESGRWSYDRPRGDHPGRMVDPMSETEQAAWAVLRTPPAEGVCGRCRVGLHEYCRDAEGSQQ